MTDDLVTRLQQKCPDDGEVELLLREAADWIDRASALLPLIRRTAGTPLAIEVSEFLKLQPPMVRPAGHPTAPSVACVSYNERLLYET